MTDDAFRERATGPREPCTVQVGPDVRVHIGSAGDIVSIEVMHEQRARPGGPVRVPGSGEPVLRTNIRGHGLPRLLVRLDAQMRVSTIQVR